MATSLDSRNHSSTIPAQQFDAEAAAAFGARTLGVLNNASLGLLISIGHQTGLFDAMSGLAPAASDEIAAHAALQPRYVKEWLGGMVVGGIVEYDRDSSTYRLPAEHAACLTRAAGTDNLAFFMQYLPMLADNEQAIISCFRTGGGVPYSRFPRFQQLEAEFSRQTHGATLIERTLPLFPQVVARLGAGADVLDIGSGHGHALILMAEAFPASQFTGYDFSEAGIRAARAEVDRRELHNIRFDVRDVATLDEPASYDLITAFDVIHDLADPRAVLRAIRTALRPDGAFFMVDIGASSELADNIEHPLGAFLYTASLMHCMTVSLAQGGAGLGTVWGEQTARRLLAEAGFERIEVERVPTDIVNAYFLAS